MSLSNNNPNTYYIRAKDVMIIHGVKKSQAYNYLQLVRDALSKKRLSKNLSQVISLQEYCQYWGMDVSKCAANLNQNGAKIIFN